MTRVVDPSHLGDSVENRAGGRRLAAYDSAVRSSLAVRPARVEDVAHMARAKGRLREAVTA
jgi:hypothetical protein